MGSQNKMERNMDYIQARKLLKRNYPQTWEVVRDLMKGKKDGYILTKHNITVRSLAGIKSNLNRSCRFSEIATACEYK